MRLAWKVAAVVVLVIAVASFAFCQDRLFLFSRDLTIQKLYSGEGYTDQYVTEIYDSSLHVGEVAIVFNEAPNASLHRFWIDVSHYNDTRLDQIVFRFPKPSNSVINIYAEASIPEVNLKSHTDRDVTIVEVNPAEDMQRGTLHFDFVAETFGTTDEVQVTTDIFLHHQTFMPLTQMKAAITVEHNFL